MGPRLWQASSIFDICLCHLGRSVLCTSFTIGIRACNIVHQFLGLYQMVPTANHTVHSSVEALGCSDSESQINYKKCHLFYSMRCPDCLQLAVMISSSRTAARATARRHHLQMRIVLSYSHLHSDGRANNVNSRVYRQSASSEICCYNVAFYSFSATSSW